MTFEEHLKTDSEARRGVEHARQLLHAALDALDNLVAGESPPIGYRAWMLEAALTMAQLEHNHDLKQIEKEAESAKDAERSSLQGIIDEMKNRKSKLALYRTRREVEADRRFGTAIRHSLNSIA
jgi:hypothetical protein